MGGARRREHVRGRGAAIVGTSGDLPSAASEKGRTKVAKPRGNSARELKLAVAAHARDLLYRRQSMPPACLLTATPDEAALLVALAVPTALDKLHLALACRRYGWRIVAAAAGAAAAGAAAADGWSVTEESARRWLVDECSAQERGWAPREGGASWLGLMWRVERLRRTLTFTSMGAGVELSAEGTVATKRYPGVEFAVCAEHPMMAGTHYVEMIQEEEGRFQSQSFMGVVGQGIDVADEKAGEEALKSAESWLLMPYYGERFHAGKSSNWEGMPRAGKIDVGDTVGLLLDLEQRTLSIYLNGARLGVMVAPGTKNNAGDAVAPLSGPLYWAVALAGGDSVGVEHKRLGWKRLGCRIKVPTAEEVAAVRGTKPTFSNGTE